MNLRKFVFGLYLFFTFTNHNIQAVPNLSILFAKFKSKVSESFIELLENLNLEVQREDSEKNSSPEDNQLYERINTIHPSCVLGLAQQHSFDFETLDY